MPTVRLWISGLAALAVPALAAQNAWVGPQPPCDVKSSSHFQVSTASLNLKIATENPTQRDRMLKQTLDVLTRAIVQNKQDKNPAAWYYFGRYYVEMGDAAGADSTFHKVEALAPQCAADIRGYRQRVWNAVLNDGLRAWQENKNDSAVALLHVALRVLPDNPDASFRLGDLYAGQNQVDSAAVYVRQGIERAGRDTAWAARRRDGLSTLARLYQAKAEQDPAVQNWERTRAARDSVNRAVAADSGVLARVLASAAARRARGARLAPADEASFRHDSSSRAQAVEAGRAGRAALAPRVAADSAAVQGAFAPAIAAYRDLATAYPQPADAAAGLANVYAESGRNAEAAGFFDSLYTSAAVAPGAVIDAGRRILATGLLVAGTRVLSRGLNQSPVGRDAWYDLALGYYRLGDSARTLPAAQRLVALDPMNRASLRLLGAAWELKGRRDSVAKYMAVVATGLGVEVSVTNFVPDSAGAVLSLTAANLRTTPSTPLRLQVEFLDAKGAVLSAQTADIPAIPPGQSQQAELHAAARGVVGWRYRAL
jgi:tetratricopeptide (TPR) repeat protein